MMSELSEDLRKILLAGLGAAAVTAEKSKEVIDELVRKGEITLEQGKALNEELKHTVSDKVKDHVTVTVNKTVPADVQGVKEAVAGMSPEELEQIKQKIAEVEQAGGTAAAAQENAGE